MLPSKSDYRLTALTLDDAEFMLNLLESAPYKKYIGDRGVRTVQQAANYIDQYFLAAQRAYGFGYDVVRDLNGEAMGMVGLMKREFCEYPDLGFAFLPEFAGRGLAFAACESYLTKVREDAEFRIIEAFTKLDNAKSQSLLTRLGFEYVGEFRHPDTEEGSSRYLLQL